jgi:peptidyl-tRNA hydrolase, PTH1 family
MSQTHYKAIVGLGNPGPQFHNTRHNIGFRIVDALAERFDAPWRTKDKMELATASINNHAIILIKPQTFMNNSGQVWGYLAKQGVKPDQLLVVHDELELPLGKIALKTGGSAKGHNGLKSIISLAGDSFNRLRFGIGRPEDKAEVPNYVLQNFKEPASIVDQLIEQAVDTILAQLA